MSRLMRVFALLWAWTGGAVLGLTILTVGTVYGFIDILNRAVTGNRAGDVVLRGAISDLIQWWVRLHHYAFTGIGELDALPPWNFTA